MPEPSNIDVTIVVPTYRSGDRIHGLVASLDAQTLDPTRFEVLLVDDGSPDDTVDRLRQIAAERPNYRVIELPPSGWPSRPRNVGIEQATGEYILFMDHDDELYPNSLRTAIDDALRQDADVFVGKEARTDQAKWALGVFSKNRDNAVGRSDVHPLIPTNPHKVYRRAMLVEHSIRFPVGGRQLWEDIFFNVDVARHANVVTVRADEPFYHWVRSGAPTTSTSFTENLDEWWTALERVIAYVDERLEDPLQHRQLMLHQLRERVLAGLGAGLLKRSEAERRLVFARAAALVDRYLTPELESALSPALRARVVLLRAGRLDLIVELAGLDAELKGISFTKAVRFAELLEIHTTTVWSAHHGGFLDVEVSDGRVLRRFGERLRAALPDELRDVTAQFQAAASTVGLRSRETAMTWLAPTVTAVSISEDADYPDIRASSVAKIDPNVFAAGRALQPGLWDVNARNTLFGVVNHRALRAVGHRAKGEVSGRRLHVYTNKHGMLSLEVKAAQ